eukprot:20647-Heterococcus_DN1.PRE.1
MHVTHCYIAAFSTVTLLRSYRCGVPLLLLLDSDEKDAQELRLIALRKALAKQHAAHPDKEMLDFSVLINPNSFTQ